MSKIVVFGREIGRVSKGRRIPAVRVRCFIMYTEEKGKNGRESTREKRHQGISAIVKQPAKYLESGDGPPGNANQYHMYRTAH